MVDIFDLKFSLQVFLFHSGNKKVSFNIKIVRHLSYPILFFDFLK